MSKEGEIGKWLERHEQEDIIILSLMAIALLSILTVLGWAYFVVDLEWGVENIKEVFKDAVKRISQN